MFQVRVKWFMRTGPVWNFRNCSVLLDLSLLRDAFLQELEEEQVEPLVVVVGTMKDLMWSFLGRFLDINARKMNIW